MNNTTQCSKEVCTPLQCGAPEGTPLRKLQLVELELMKRFKALCEEQGFVYYLLGGTLLGAVRHGGFIPWDDDVDLCMPRPDYQRFLAYVQAHPDCFSATGQSQVAAQSRTKDAYQIKLEPITCESIYTNKFYRQGMAKLCSPAVKLINRSADKERLEEAWIDIIPLDGFPAGRFAQLMHKLRLSYWKLMDASAQFDYVVDTKRDRGLIGNTLIKLLRMLFKVCRPYGDDYRKVLSKTERALQRYSYESEDLLINLYAARGFREIFKKTDFGCARSVAFEDDSFSAPADTHSILECIYGADYMQPPAEDDRNWHNSEVVEAH